MDEEKKITSEAEVMDFPEDPGCLCLPEDMMESTDFKAEEAIKLDLNVQLPEAFSLGKWIYKTSNQGALGSCTSMGTTHATQILNVKKGGVEPTKENIITPDWKDLWSKMGHSTTKYDGGDYVERAVSTALKQGIKTVEKGDEVKFDGYAYGDWNKDDKSIEMMKRYLYQGNPIVWCVRGDKQMWSEMSKGEVVTVPKTPTGGHCIALVGWDNAGMRFINSWSHNDGKGLKSRFHIPYDIMKKIVLNFRYWILYIKEEAKIDPERLKKINVYAVVIEVLKKYYQGESQEVKNGIVALSQPLRKAYPELNEKVPL